jgi:hypothetical protein
MSQANFFPAKFPFGNPFTGMLFSASSRAPIREDATSEAQSFVCDHRGQMVWIASAAEGLPADKVGECANIQSCRGTGVPLSAGALYPVSFGNAIAVISCSDVVVVGAGYKTYMSGDNEIPSKNAFAWRSSLIESERVRFLHRHVGCEQSNLSTGVACGSTCAGGYPCSSNRARSAEALSISSNGLNIIGEFYPGASAENRFGSSTPYKAGFLWRGVYQYPSNNGDLQELSTTTVTNTGLSDSFQLHSAFYDPNDNVPPNYADSRGIAVLSGGDIAMTGVHSSASVAPIYGVGAQWPLLSSFANGQQRRIAGVSAAGASEFYDVQEVLAADQSDDALSAAGSTYDASRGTFTTVVDNLLDSVVGTPLPGEIRCPANFTGDCRLAYQNNRITSMSSDGLFSVGHMFNSNSLMTTDPTLGKSYFYGFQEGLPVVWSSGVAPTAIQLPANTRGGIAWNVASLGNDRAIVVGNYLPVASQFPVGFVSVCTKGATSLCCSPAEPLRGYLSSRGVALPAGVELLTATDVKVRGREAYFSGTGRGYSSSSTSPRAFAAKVAFSEDRQCSRPACN